MSIRYNSVGKNKNDKQGKLIRTRKGVFGRVVKVLRTVLRNGENRCSVLLERIHNKGVADKFCRFCYVVSRSLTHTTSSHIVFYPHTQLCAKGYGRSCGSAGASIYMQHTVSTLTIQCLQVDMPFAVDGMPGMCNLSFVCWCVANYLFQSM